MSEEVRHEGTRRDHVWLVRNGIKHLKLVIVILVKLQNGRFVTATARAQEAGVFGLREVPVTIIRRRPDSDERLVKIILEAFIYELMRSTNHFQTVQVAELIA